MVHLEIVVSGERWLGKGFISVYSKMADMIRDAKHTIIIAVYQLKSKELIDLLQSALKRGVHVTVYASHTDIHFRHRNLTLHIMDNITLHAKIVVVDGRKILVGSSNYTYSGFFRNYELGVYIESEELAFEITKLVREMSE